MKNSVFLFMLKHSVELEKALAGRPVALLHRLGGKVVVFILLISCMQTDFSLYLSPLSLK